MLVGFAKYVIRSHKWHQFSNIIRGFSNFVRKESSKGKSQMYWKFRKALYIMNRRGFNRECLDALNFTGNYLHCQNLVAQQRQFLRSVFLAIIMRLFVHEGQYLSYLFLLSVPCLLVHHYHLAFHLIHLCHQHPVHL